MLEKIKYINNYINDHLWMDFEVCSIGRSKLQIYGYIDESEEDKILIEFEFPYAFDGVFSFSYDGEGDFISIVEGNEAYDLNVKYSVIKGNTIFKISNINISKDILIVAQNITVHILDSGYD